MDRIVLNLKISSPKKEGRLTQLGGAIINDENKVVRVFSYKIKASPFSEIDGGYMKSNREEYEFITGSKYEDAKDVIEKFIEVMNYCNPHRKKNYVLIGYNLSKSIKYLEKLMQKYNYDLYKYCCRFFIDTKSLAINLLPEEELIKNHKRLTLQAVLDFFKINFLVNEQSDKFNPLNHILAELILYSKVNKLFLTFDKFLENYFEEQINIYWSNIYDIIEYQVLKNKDLQWSLKFGKHKDETLLQVLIEDPKYLIWLYKKASSEQNNTLLSWIDYNVYQLATKIIDMNQYCDIDVVKNLYKDIHKIEPKIRFNEKTTAYLSD